MGSSSEVTARLPKDAQVACSELQIHMTRQVVCFTSAVVGWVEGTEQLLILYAVLLFSLNFPAPSCNKIAQVEFRVIRVPY